MAYTVQQLAKLSKVSVRTLHHYDEVGLLKPAYYGSNGYRYYEKEQLLLLQQILFFRNLGFELQKIRSIINKGDFDKLSALFSHRKILLKELEKTRELITTIDNTIQHLKGRKTMKDQQFFKGLNSPKQQEYEKYIVESGHYNREEMEQNRKKLEKWTSEDWQKVQANWDQLLNDYVTAIKNRENPDSLVAHNLVVRHLQHLKQFGIEVRKEELVNKANFFLGHPDWKKELDGRHPQLLEFMLAAMKAYCEK
jgi:DNA-binding transcriptional MerR regulator